MFGFYFNVLKTIAGRKCLALPPLRIISRTMVDATEVYFGSPVRKIVSISYLKYGWHPQLFFRIQNRLRTVCRAE